MASSKDYIEFIMEQLSLLDGVSYRAMMGEYIIYYRGKVIGGSYDDRFLVKETKSSKELMPCAKKEPPYEGTREMLLIENIEDKEFLKNLIEKMYEELPEKRGLKKYVL